MKVKILIILIILISLGAGGFFIYKNFIIPEKLEKPGTEELLKEEPKEGILQLPTETIETQTPTFTPTPAPVPTPSPAPRAILPDLIKVADLPGGHISDIAFAPSNPEVLYLASNVNAMGVWRSDDTGETWQRVLYDDNFGATHINTLVIHPKNQKIIIVSDLHGRISKTSDGGINWTEEYEKKAAIFALAISSSQPNIMYAGAGGDILKSVNEGETWNVVGQVDSKRVGSLAIDPSRSEIVYAGAHNGVYKSTDGGKNWKRIFPTGLLEFKPVEVVEVTVASIEPNLVMAATPQGVYRSSDGGQSWQRTLKSHAHAVKVAPSDSRVVYAGTKQGIYKSNDGGITWISYSSGIQNLDMGPLTIHPQDPDTVLTGSNIWQQWVFHHDNFPASTKGEGIYKTTNGGISWTKIIGGFVDVDVVAVAVDPNNPNVAYVGVECSRGIFRTENGGASWEFISGGPEKGSWDIGHYTMRLATDPNSNVYLTGRFGFTQSSNRGQSWTSTLPRRHFHGMGINPYDPDVIFVGTSPKQDPTESSDYPGARILRSTDGGSSWQEVGSGFPSGADTSIHGFAFDPNDSNIVYVVTSSHEIGLPRTSTTLGIYKSVDRGETWISINNGLTTLEVDSIVASPATPGLLYAGTENGVFRSANAGANWMPTNLTKSIRSLLIDPIDTDSIFAGTQEGLFWSSDGGSTWQQIKSVPTGPVTGLAMDDKGQALYAVLNDVGIFKGVRE